MEPVWAVARAAYKMVDLYAAFAIDKINKTPTAVAGLFDSTATGLTIGADAYVTDKTLVSLWYDNLDVGGMLDQRKSATFVEVQAKHYIRTNGRSLPATISTSENPKGAIRTRMENRYVRRLLGGRHA